MGVGTSLSQSLLKQSTDFQTRMVIKKLAHVLFVDGVEEGSDAMTLDEFDNQPHRQEGLVDGLGIMISKWLVPPKHEKDQSLIQKLCSSLPQRYKSKRVLAMQQELPILHILDNDHQLGPLPLLYFVKHVGMAARGLMQSGFLQ